MSNLTTTVANALLDHLTNVATYTPAPPFKLALVTVLGSASAAGTEVVGGTYARQTVAFSAAAGQATGNSGTIGFTGMPDCTVVGGEVYDNNGVRVAWGPLTANIVCVAGSDIAFDPGDLTLTIP